LLLSLSDSVSLSTSLQPSHIVMADATSTFDARLTMTRLRSIVSILQGHWRAISIRADDRSAVLPSGHSIPEEKRLTGARTGTRGPSSITARLGTAKVSRSD
jgi:hypothetical protein